MPLTIINLSKPFNYIKQYYNKYVQNDILMHYLKACINTNIMITNNINDLISIHTI